MKTQNRNSKYFGFKGTRTCSETTGTGLAVAGYWTGKVLGGTVGVLVDGVVNASQGIYHACRPSTPAELRAKAAAKEAKLRAKTEKMVIVDASNDPEDEDLPTIEERSV